MKISDLNIERCLFLLYERNDVLWLTIADSCGLDVVSYDTWDWQNAGNNIPAVTCVEFTFQWGGSSGIGVLQITIGIPR